MSELPQTSPEHYRQIHDWILAVEAGAVSPAAQAEFEKKLLEDEAFRRAYLQYTQESALLHFDAHEGDALVHADPPGSPGPRPLARLWGVLAAAALLIAAGLGWWGLQESGQQHKSGPRLTTSAGVAVLTGTLDAVWPAESPALESGAVLSAGPLKITQGLLQIEFFSGAALVVEGPADLELVSADQAICHQGRVRAHVPPQAIGFTLKSAACRVVDLGTEFGLEVRADGRTEVHVFDGEVRLENRPGQPDPLEMKAGAARRFTRSEAEQPVPLRPADFADPAVFQQRSVAHRLQRLQRWQESRRAIAEDPGLVVYFDFEDQSPWDRTLKNRAAAPAVLLDGAVIGARWSEGRWPGKGALEFKGPGDRVRLNVPGVYESMTFMAWVRFDGFDRWLSSLLLTDGWEPGEPHWQVSWDGEIILGVRGPGNHFSPRLLGARDLGRWVHLVTVFDAAAGQVRHYLDGREAGVNPIRGPLPLVIGPAEIGNWGEPMTADHRVRNLNGRIDEFAVFSRVLDAGQIAALYEAGRPE